MAEEVGSGPVDDDAVPAFWRALGLPGLVDAHVHFMPQGLLDRVWGYFDAAGPLIGRPWPIAYRLAEEDRLARLRALGVRAFPSLIYAHKPDMAAALNEWAADFARRVPECLHTATFFPEPGVTGYVRAALAGGARVFKAHVQVGGYDPRDPLLEPVWGQLAAAGSPVVVHCGSGPQPGRFTGPGPVSAVLAAHPDLVVIVAHLGMPEYADFLALAARRPRLYLDTTMVWTDFTEQFAPFPPELVPMLADLGIGSCSAATSRTSLTRTRTSCGR